MVVGFDTCSRLTKEFSDSFWSLSENHPSDVFRDLMHARKHRQKFIVSRDIALAIGINIADAPWRINTVNHEQNATVASAVGSRRPGISREP